MLSFSASLRWSPFLRPAFSIGLEVWLLAVRVSHAFRGVRSIRICCRNKHPQFQCLKTRGLFLNTYSMSFMTLLVKWPRWGSEPDLSTQPDWGCSGGVELRMLWGRNGIYLSPGEWEGSDEDAFLEELMLDLSFRIQQKWARWRREEERCFHLRWRRRHLERYDAKQTWNILGRVNNSPRLSQAFWWWDMWSRTSLSFLFRKSRAAIVPVVMRIQW